MKTIIMFIALAILLGLFLFSRKQKRNIANHPAINVINANQLKKIISDTTAIQLVDVRTSMEYGKGHINDAVNIDYMGNNFVEKFKSYDKEKPLYLYCRSGNRSGKAALFLAQEGFTEIYDLEGGIVEWDKP